MCSFLDVTKIGERNLFTYARSIQHHQMEPLWLSIKTKISLLRRANDGGVLIIIPRCLLLTSLTRARQGCY